MRKLQTKDVFAALRVITEANIRYDLRAVVATAQSGREVDVQNLGFDVILTCIEHLSGKGAEKLVYDFLAGPWEVDPSEIPGWELSRLSETFRQWRDGYVDKEELMSFWKALSGLMR